MKVLADVNLYYSSYNRHQSRTLQLPPNYQPQISSAFTKTNYFPSLSLFKLKGNKQDNSDKVSFDDENKSGVYAR